MIKAARFVINLLLWKSRLDRDKLAQEKGGYWIGISKDGLERDITYKEGSREIGVLADFNWSNDVLLYTDSLRQWIKPFGEEVTPFDYQRILNRVIQHLSCWGAVTLDNTKLPDHEDLKKSLSEQGISYTELENGVIHYTVDADTLRKEQKLKS